MNSMLHLAVITITCRQNPRLSEVAKTLVASHRHAGADIELSWFIIDELDRDVTALTGLDDSSLPDGFGVVVVKPPIAEARAAIDRLPAHNTARNAGLSLARGSEDVAPVDYVVLLNDCNLVTLDWVSVARDCSRSGVGWKCKSHLVADYVAPEDGVVHYRDHNDRLRTVPAMTVAGSCWGAPMAAFESIGGFDTAYDGQHKNGDIDAIVRMSRLNLSFVCTERAYTVQMRRTKIPSEITTSKEADASARNQNLFNALLRDKARIYPSGDPRNVDEPAVALAKKPPERPMVVSRRGRRAVDPAPIVAPRRGRDAPPPRPPVDKAEFKRTKVGQVQGANVVAFHNPKTGEMELEVTNLEVPGQLAKDDLYKTYTPTGSDEDAAIIGKPLADRIAANGKSDDEILDDLGDLT